MNINISSIKIHSISHLGSLNIGKTILCRNTSLAALDPEGTASGKSPAAPPSPDAGDKGLPDGAPGDAPTVSPDGPTPAPREDS